MNEVNILDLAEAIIRKAREKDSAAIMIGQTGRFRSIYKISPDLNSEVFENAPKSFGAMKFISVTNASDRNAYIYLIIGKRDMSVKAFKMSIVENRNIELDEAVNEFHIYYPAQSGKTIELTYSEFVKTSNKDVDVLTNLSTGSSRTLLTPITIPALAGTPVELLPVDADRIEAVLYFSVDVYLLTSASDIKANGLPVLAGERYIDTNKGALYIVSQDTNAGTATGLIHK